MEKEMLAIAKLKSGEGKFEKIHGISCNQMKEWQ